MKKTAAILMALLLAFGLMSCGSDDTGAASSSDTETQAVTETTEETTVEETTEETTTEETTTEEVKDDTVIRIAGLKGPTSMGLIQVMDNAENGTAANNYEFTLAGSADEVTPSLISGDLDMAAVPANLAAVLYNKTEGQIEVLAVNTLGVLYIVEKGESISSVADLKGKTIYASGKGSTPEYALRYILSENGIDPDNDVTIEWRSEHSEVVSDLSAADSAIALLPQPFVTVAQTQVENLNVALDLTEEWDKLGTDSMLITGVLVARKEFVEEHQALVDSFLEEYEASVNWVNANNEEAAALIEKFDIIKAAVAQKALPYCNITFMAGDDMKAPLSGYLQTLYDQNPAAVGGAMPADDFYYGAE